MEVLAAFFAVVITAVVVVMMAMPFIIALIAVTGGLALGAWLIYVLAKYLERQ